MAIRGALNHLDLTVTDRVRSAVFYQRVLGQLGFDCDTSHDTPVFHSRYPGTAGWEIALQDAQRDTQHDRYAPGLHHLAFHAASRQEVDDLYTLLQEMDAQILDPPTEYSGSAYSPGYYAVFFADPDGLKLEVVHEPRLNP